MSCKSASITSDIVIVWGLMHMKDPTCDGGTVLDGIHHMYEPLLMITVSASDVQAGANRKYPFSQRHAPQAAC
jgi:hypothetical protein